MIDLKRHLKSLSSPFIVKHFPLQPAFLGVKSSGDSSFQEADFESFLRPSIAHSSQLRSLHLLAPTVPVFCFSFENLPWHGRHYLHVCCGAVDLLLYQRNMSLTHASIPDRPWPLGLCTLKLRRGTTCREESTSILYIDRMEDEIVHFHLRWFCQENELIDYLLCNYKDTFTHNLHKPTFSQWHVMTCHWKPKGKDFGEHWL